MEKELKALADIIIGILYLYHHQNKPISCKWVYKTKLKVDDPLERCKLRLIKGFTQQYELDYEETFSQL